MLQIDITPFASDALEDAMRLAQTKALNSFTFSDCMNYLNYAWNDVYNRLANIDSGYYSKVVRLTQKLTKLPPFVKNTIRVFRAQSPIGYNRLIYRESGQSDMVSSGTYHISGTDLYCPDAGYSDQIWLEYVPVCPQIFFTHHNRDPIIHSSYNKTMNDLYGSSTLRAYRFYDEYSEVENPTGNPSAQEYYEYSELLNGYTLSADTTVDTAKTYYTKGDTKHYHGEFVNWSTDESLDLKDVQYWVMYNRYTHNYDDISEYVLREADDEGVWELVYITCDLPYIFCSYQHSTTRKFASCFYTATGNCNEYNPFEFLGKCNNVCYLTVTHNDKTGMSAVIKDYNDTTSVVTTVNKPTATYPSSTATITIGTKTIDMTQYAHGGNPEPWTEYNYNEDLLRVATTYTVEITVVSGNFVVKETDTVNTPTPVIKELGWTPDTKLIYPAPEVYRYLVAKLADKFAALNESSVMGVQLELAEAEYAFNQYLDKNKSSFKRIENVNPATIMDWIV